MKLGTNLNEETNEVNIAYLDFETKKRILLSAEELEEFKDWVRAKVAEAKVRWLSCQNSETPST